MKRLLLVALSFLAVGCDENNTVGDQLACLATPCAEIHVTPHPDSGNWVWTTTPWIAVTTYRGLPPDTAVYRNRHEAIAGAWRQRALDETGLLRRRSLIYIDTASFHFWSPEIEAHLKREHEREKECLWLKSHSPKAVHGADIIRAIGDQDDSVCMPGHGR